MGPDPASFLRHTIAAIAIPVVVLPRPIWQLKKSRAPGGARQQRARRRSKSASFGAFSSVMGTRR